MQIDTDAIEQQLGETTQTVQANLPTDEFWSRVLAALVIVALVYVADFLIVRMLDRLRLRDRLSHHAHAVLRRIAYWVIVSVGFVLVLEQFGLMQSAWAMLTALLAMVAVGFVATWSVLSNMFCAIVLMITRPFDVGDTIEITGDNLRGRAIDFNLMFTTLRDEDGSLLQVPNNTFFQKPIRRFVGTATRSLDEQADQEQPME